MRVGEHNSCFLFSEYLKKNTMGYYENYLISNHWKEIKRECKEIGLFSKCIICGKDKLIQIHHLNYECKFHEDILKDLVPLCPSCHKYVHERMKANKVTSMTMKEFKDRFINWSKTPTKTKKQRELDSKKAYRKWKDHKNKIKWEKRQQRKRIKALEEGKVFKERTWEEANANYMNYKRNFHY
jgi:hypothetical protein